VSGNASDARSTPAASSAPSPVREKKHRDRLQRGQRRRLVRRCLRGAAPPCAHGLDPRWPLGSARRASARRGRSETPTSPATLIGARPREAFRHRRGFSDIRTACSTPSPSSVSKGGAALLLSSTRACLQEVCPRLPEQGDERVDVQAAAVVVEVPIVPRENRDRAGSIVPVEFRLTGPSARIADVRAKLFVRLERQEVEAAVARRRERHRHGEALAGAVSRPVGGGAADGGLPGREQRARAGRAGHLGRPVDQV
jgi:hypothetical protein